MDNNYMKIALDAAEKGCGFVTPNPMVGAVIVKDTRIIGVGYHERYGGLHAERNALANCSETPNGATMYVTLEPCCHYGKTPPCTEAIVEQGISKVVVGSSDPNPLVAGKGIETLKKVGVEVVTGVMKEECDKLNEVFFHYIKNKTPYVVMKYAMTADGKIATTTGKSKWITGEKARVNVHHNRSRYSSIMVGVETVIKDDPMLNCRIEEGVNPIRIVCDTHLRIPLESRVIKTAYQIRTIIITCDSRTEKAESLKVQGCEILTVSKKDNHVDLTSAMKRLGAIGIDSVIIEGGATLNWSALECRIVNKIQCYIAPKLFGGHNAKNPVGGKGVDYPSNAVRIVNRTATEMGDDILIEGEVEYQCSQE